MLAERFWELLSKRSFAEASAEELKELDDMFVQQPDLKATAESLILLSQQPTSIDINADPGTFSRHIARMKEAGIEFSEGFSDSNFDVLAQGSSTRAKKKMIYWGLVTAAVLGLGFTLNSYRLRLAAQRSLAGTPSAISQVTTKPASKTQIRLPDGSSVWLNASSNLTYDKEFGKDFREVNLTGEAFFDVVKDPSHPFIIHTKVIDVKVLGTEFNVKAYPNDSYTETSLIRGSVEITVKNRPDERHFLKPNEKMRVANDVLNDVVRKASRPEPLILTEPLSYLQADSSVIETSWVNNRLILQQNETFREDALKMERWYGVHINFAYQGVADDYRPFVSFKNETVTQALDELKEGFKFNYKIDADNITIVQ